MGFAKRSTENGKILAEYIHRTTVDFAIAGYDTIAEIGLILEAKIVGPVFYKSSDFLKGAFVD